MLYLTASTFRKQQIPEITNHNAIWQIYTNVAQEIAKNNVDWIIPRAICSIQSIQHVKYPGSVIGSRLLFFRSITLHHFPCIHWIIRLGLGKLGNLCRYDVCAPASNSSVGQLNRVKCERTLKANPKSKLLPCYFMSLVILNTMVMYHLQWDVLFIGYITMHLLLEKWINKNYYYKLLYYY